MSKPQRTERDLKRLGIPTETDWGNYSADLDQNWAHQHYYGKTNEEMQKYFRNNPIEGASDLRFMPEVPFRYYMLGYRDYVMSGNLGIREDASAADCFLSLVRDKLEKDPRYIVPIMSELLPAIEHVATHQEEFNAAEHIFGNFLERLERIRTLYADAKDRYRRL
jgi:hypothetical protein